MLRRPPPPPRPVARVRLLAALAAVTALGVLLAACGSNESPTPTGPGTPAPSATSPEASPSPAPSEDGGTSASPEATGTTSVGQTDTDTDVGRIWDALPSGFPAYPGSNPTETGEGPVSGQFSVDADVPTVATFLQAALEGAGFSTQSQSGPFEDGRIVIVSVGPDSPECLVETTIAPAGGTTLVSVLYGSACPMS